MENINNTNDKFKINCLLTNSGREINLEIEKLKTLKTLKRLIKENSGLEKSFKIIYNENDISNCGKIKLKDLFVINIQNDNPSIEIQENIDLNNHFIKLKITLKTRPIKSSLSERKLKYMLECPIHFNENAHFYCFLCKLSFCTLCIEDHHPHDYIDKYDYSKTNEEIVNCIMEEFIHSVRKIEGESNNNKNIFSHIMNQIDISTDTDSKILSKFNSPIHEKGEQIFNNKIEELKISYTELVNNNHLLLRERSLRKLEDFKTSLLKFKMICHNSLNNKNKKFSDYIVLEEEYFLEIHKTLKELDTGKKALIKYMQTLNKEFEDDSKSLNIFHKEIQTDLDKIIKKIKHKLKIEDEANISKCDENILDTSINSLHINNYQDKVMEFFEIDISKENKNSEFNYICDKIKNSHLFENSIIPLELFSIKYLMKRRLGMEKKPPDIILFNILSKKFEIRKIKTKAEMKFKKFLPFSVFINVGNILYISGGKRKNGKCTNEFFSFNPENNELVRLPNLAKERCSHSMIHTGNSNQIIVVGGYSNNTCEKYSTIDKKWEKLPDLNYKERQVSTLFINNENVICSFGYINNEIESVDFLEKLNLSQPDKWELIQIKHSLNKYDLKLFNVGLIQINPNQFLICGGEHYQGEETDNVYLLDMRYITVVNFNNVKLPLKCSFIDKNFQRYSPVKFAQYEMKKNNLISFNSAKCKFKSIAF